MENDWQADVDRFAAALDADEKSPLTVRNYRRELRVFADWYRATYQEPPGVRDLTHEDMRAYKDSLRDRKLEPATINLALAALRSFLRWALASKLIKEPVPTPKTARQVQRVPRWLTRVQERRLVKVVRQGGVKQHLGLVETFLVFGLRISEAAALEWGDIAMGRTEAVLKVRKGKGSKQRDLPFGGNQRARDALLLLGWKEWGKDKGRRVLQGQRGPLSASGLKQLLTPYGRAAEIDGFSAHVLRHTCAKRMLERKPPADIPTIARWMGHSSLNTTFLYTLPSQAELAIAAGGGDACWEDDD